MLRDLQETDVKAICDINQEALGYTFSPEETASQLARLSQDMSTLKFTNHSIPKQDLIS
ncbi:acetyltransferase [Streptococcus pneumoniae]|nr:acetyltransferase [Streptococcus pneumoniae]